MYQHVHLYIVCITSVTWNNYDIFTALFSLLYFKLNQKQAKLSSAQTMTMSTTGSGGTRTKLENTLMKMSEAQSMGRGGEGMIHEPNQQISCQYNMC